MNTPILDDNSYNSLSSLMTAYGATMKWIYLTFEEKDGKIEKSNPCGRKDNWSYEECFKKANGLTVVREWDISNTKLAMFDDDKRDRTLEETIKEYPFLEENSQLCYYTKGNTKGYHFFIEHEEFINATKIQDHINKRDLITNVVWSRHDKLKGDKIISVDIMKIQELFPKFKTSSKELEVVINNKTNNDVGKIIIDKSNTNKFLKKLLDNINIEYCEDFQSWFDIVGALKSTKNNSYIDYFSKKSSKYKKGNYDSIVNSIIGTNYSIGTIYHFSKESNRQKHFEILSEFNQIPIKPYEELGDSDYATIFIDICDDVFYHSLQECYYCFNSNKCIWEVTNKENLLSITTDTLVEYLNREMRSIYSKLSKLEICVNTDSNCNCNSCSNGNNYNKQIKQLGKNIKSCKYASNTKHTIEYIFNKLKNQGKDILMDANPLLFCWENKTYDIENKKFIDRSKYLYITTTTGYYYEEPTINYTSEIDTLMKNIFSDEEVGKCYFSVCKSGLTGKLEEKFILANGSGGNGKGMINGMMKTTLGNYYHDVSHSIITKEITDDKPLPALAKLGGKRFCCISEIKEDSLLLEDSIKKLTNPIINARGLYSSQTRIINTATYVAECNARPKITGENGDAMGRRYLDVEFDKKYTFDKEKLKLNGYLQANELYKKDEWTTPRRIAFFFWLLNFNDKIYEPTAVKKRSAEFLKDCNILQSVFHDNIEKCESDNTKQTILTAVDFLSIVRASEEYKNLEKAEKKLYTKGKIIDFIKKNFNSDFKEKHDITNPKRTTIRNCIIGYRNSKICDELEEED